MIGHVIESANSVTLPQLPFVSLSPSLSLPLFPGSPFLQPAWFLMVGGDWSFKLALTEKVKEFSNQLREDCEVRGIERSEREREGRGGRGGGSQSVRWFHPLALIVCVLKWKCPVSRAKGVFLLSPCVHVSTTHHHWWPSLLSTSCRSILMCTVVWWRGVLWRQKSLCQQ